MSNRGVTPATRSTTISPIAVANLNPCPEHALTTTTRFGVRRMHVDDEVQVRRVRVEAHLRLAQTAPSRAA